MDKELPLTERERRQHRIRYYQWVIKIFKYADKFGMVFLENPYSSIKI